MLRTTRSQTRRHAPPLALTYNQMVIDTEQERASRRALSRARRPDPPRHPHAGAARAHSVSDLARRYPISFPPCTSTSERSSARGCVTKTRHGREQHVRGDVEMLRTAHLLLDELEALWRERVNRIDQLLAETRMPVTSVVKDADARTVTITARFDASIERVWRVWSNRGGWSAGGDRPASRHHDRAPPGAGRPVAYSMTGPEGDVHHGRWDVRAVDRAARAGVRGRLRRRRRPPRARLPTGLIRVALSELAGGRTQMVVTTPGRAARRWRRSSPRARTPA